MERWEREARRYTRKKEVEGRESEKGIGGGEREGERGKGREGRGERGGDRGGGKRRCDGTQFSYCTWFCCGNVVDSRRR